jgi:hypothetical protein
MIHSLALDVIWQIMQVKDMPFLWQIIKYFALLELLGVG